MSVWFLNDLPGVNQKVLPFYLLALVGKSEGNETNSPSPLLMKASDISSFSTEKQRDRIDCAEGGFEKTGSVCDCLSKKG